MPEPATKRVVVKFKPQVSLPYRDAEALLRFEEQTGHKWGELTDRFPGVRFQTYFRTVPEEKLKVLNKTKPIHGKVPFAFNSYFAVVCPSTVDSAAVAKHLRGWSTVLTAYAEGRPSRPAVDPTDDVRYSEQQYLHAAKLGIDAEFAWNHADGAGIQFVDLECGWKLDHEDLADAGITKIWGDESTDVDDINHGTNALGVVVGVDNKVGGIGIAPQAATRVVSYRLDTDDHMHVAEAIVAATTDATPVDVLLIEVELRWNLPAGAVTLPVEVDPAVFEVILNATSRGVTVVEPAANAGYDLDSVVLDGEAIFDRTVRDSGAILVGAATADTTHSRLELSNYGSRVDCFAWGEGIVAPAYFGDGNVNKYTTNFTGTSGAAAIVAGAAILLQSWAKQVGTPFTTSELRGRLSDRTDGVNTPSEFADTDLIGVMPNLKHLIPVELKSESEARRQYK